MKLAKIPTLSDEIKDEPMLVRKKEQPLEARPSSMLDPLADVKARDSVTVMRGRDVQKIVTVEQLTKTLIITSDDDRWRRKDGQRQGSDHRWVVSRITPTTDAHRRYVKRRYLTSRIRNGVESGQPGQGLGRLTIEQLESVLAILEQGSTCQKGD